MANTSKDALSLQSHHKERIMYTMKVTPMNFPPYNWLKEAKVYNKKYELISYDWLKYNADIIVALFTAKDIDYKGFLPKFYETYENSKLVNLPIEVIFIPMDDTEEDARECFETQANWFTMKFGDDMIPLLIYMYGISSIPHLMVLRVDGTLISGYGLVDFEEYGRNVLISWLSSSSSNKTHRRLSRETMYGPSWKYLTGDGEKKTDYQRKFRVGQSSSSPPPES